MSESSDAVTNGPLAVHIEPLCGELIEAGWRPATVYRHRLLLRELDGWAQQEHPGRELRDEVVEEFFARRRQAGFTVRYSTTGMAPVLDRLRVKGAITSARVATASSPKGRPDNEKDPVLAAFVAYMRVERRFAASTVETRWDIARHFRATLPDDLAEVVPGHVVTFLLGEVERLKPSAAAKVGDGVRAFLRYLFATGALDRDLSSLALTVRAQRRSPLPKAVDPASVRAMLDSCDRTKAIGLRDLAVLTVMARLGLRAGEVAAISLDDIDWDAAELVVHGKGRRTERLPLPGDVGEVVATWLRDGRPACPSRALFVNLHGHYGGSMTSRTVAIRP
jgi:integrase/recombinase XerD